MDGPLPFSISYKPAVSNAYPGERYCLLAGIKASLTARSWGKLLAGLIWIFLCTAVVPLLSQTYSQPTLSIEHIGPKEGLNSEKVISVVQDHIGFLWIGTQEGLHRYDGYELSLYQHDPEDSLSLSHNIAEALYVDRSGTLWVGTWNGLNRFSPETNSFQRYEYDPTDPTSLSSPQIHSIIEDAEGRLWIATRDGGVCRYDPQTDAFVRYLHDPKDPASLSYDVVFTLYVDKQGTLWVGTGLPWDNQNNRGGLNRYLPDQDAFERFEHAPGDPNSLTYNEISALYEDQEGRFWVATWGDGLQILDRETGKFLNADESTNRFPAAKWPQLRNPNGPNGAIRFIHEDSQGMVWIGGFLGGLDRYDPTLEFNTHFAFDSQDPTSLSDNAVWSVYEDRHEILWISTWKGLNKINPAYPKFELVAEGKNGFSGLFDSHVEEILIDSEGIIWTGTWAGLESFDPASGKRTLYELGKSLPENGINEMVLILHESRNKDIWFGTLQYGLIHFDRSSETFTIYRHDSDDPTSISGNTITDMHDHPSGAFWVSHTSGLDLFDPNTDRFSAVLDTLVTDPSQLDIQAMNPTGENFWIGSGAGLDLYDPINNTLTPFLRGYTIMCIQEDRQGSLWLGTSGQGLIHFDPATREYTIFTTREGVPSNNIRGLIMDDQGQLWISTQLGLAWIPSNSRTIRTFTSTTAPAVQEFYPHSVTKSADGDLLFGGNGGYIRFDPRAIQPDTITPIPVLTGLRLFNKELDFSDQVDSTQTIRLDYNQNDLTFEYAGLHFIQPGENNYRYLLENYEKNWRYVGTQRSAIYPNLPPGSYTFRVQSANQDGTWSRESASLQVEISPPWWKTIWALLFFGVVCVTGAYFGYRIQRNRLLTRERTRANLEEAKLRTEMAEAKTLQFKELDEAKANLYANITHEFRTPLTVIMGMVEEIDGHSKAREIISRNSQNLLRLINQLLDLAKLDSGSLKLSMVHGDILNYLQYLTESFYSLANEKDLRLTFYSEVDELVMDFDEEKIQHIIYNLLSNAIKFTEKSGKIVLHANQVIQEERHFLQLKVQDTGVGIPAEKVPHIFDRFFQVNDSRSRENEGTGIGLALTRELIELMNGNISVESRKDKGTTFTILLPIIHQLDTPLLPSSTSFPVPVFSGSGPISSKNPEREEQAESQDERPVLLLIEDNVDVVTYILTILEEEYDIHTAPNGQVGIDQAFEIVPDIIISDVMMPEKDGYEVCSTLKKDERTSHIPIILLTAKATVDARIDGLKVGADAYLIKPFHKEELLVRLAKLVELRQAIQARYASTSSIATVANTQKEPSLDDLFLQKLVNLVEERMTDHDLGVAELCRAVSRSNTQVNRKLKALTGKTPSQFIRSIRLQRAMELLQSSDLNISEIAYEVGFNDPNYFSRLYSEEFGHPPNAERK